MLDNIADSQVNGNRKWVPITSLTLALLSTAVLCLPSFSAETMVQRKVYMTNDGVTETTTTTTTERAYPSAVVGVDRVVVPATPVVERVIVPAPATVAADTVVVPAVPTTTIEKVVVPATPVEKVVIDSAVYKTTLQDRQARLRAVIANGLANGTMTEASAARYRAELDRLASLELSLDAKKQLTYERVLPMAFEYDLIRSNLNVVELQPIVQGSKVVFSNTHVVAIDDLMRRRAGLEAKISYEFANGKLTAGEADRLRGMLNSVAVIENEYRGDGEITDKEAKALYTEFDRVGSAIDKAI